MAWQHSRQSNWKNTMTKNYPHELYDFIRNFIEERSYLKDEYYIEEFRNTLEKALQQIDPELESKREYLIENVLYEETDKKEFKKYVKDIFTVTFDKDQMKERLLEKLSLNKPDEPELSEIINKAYEEGTANKAIEERQFKAIFKEGFNLVKWKRVVRRISTTYPDFQSFKKKLVYGAFEDNILRGDELLKNVLDKILRNDPDKDEFTKTVEARFKNLLVNEVSIFGFKKKDILKVYDIVKSHYTEKDILEIEKLTFQKPLIVPPGLNSAVLHFEAHFAVSGDDPIMILGQTGVGKSMFLYLAKRLFKKQRQYDSSPSPIVEANCAHFTGSGSGYSLARSELFGHVKGAFTDAHDKKVGLVEKANGGLLILEEVGELPKEVQAMLLTFIETGEYRKLGSEELETATVKVVAATNRESALRDDFRYRFFPYYIPPLRERKGDILYYFHEIFPELTKNFTKSEVLMLLTHHWPGNVREIERIGRLLNRERWINAQIHKHGHDDKASPPEDRLSHLDPRDTTFDPTILDKILNDLKIWDIDIRFLEKLLQKYRVSINGDANKKAFKELSSKDSGWFSRFDEYTLRFCEEYSPFNEAYEGYLLFCDLFMQNPVKEDNILATIKSQCTFMGNNEMRHSFDDKSSYQKPMKILRRKIMKFLMGVDGTEYDHIDNPWLFWDHIQKDQLEFNKDNFGLEPGTEELVNAIAEYKEMDLLKLYYRKQLEKTGGNIRAAAKRVGMNEGTFRNRLKKVQLDSKPIK